MVRLPADTPEFTRADALRDALRALRRATRGSRSSASASSSSSRRASPARCCSPNRIIAIHTWPEAGFVTVDVYVCNFTTDNTAKAEQVFAALKAVLQPQRAHFQAIHRGGKDA